jgi:hypothetical protein
MFCNHGRPECRSHWADLTMQTEFTNRNEPIEVDPVVARRGEHRESDREIIRRANLREIGRREVHHNTATREVKAGCSDGGLDSLSGFANSGIGKPDDDEFPWSLGNDGLDLYRSWFHTNQST